jgi:hypothetical protein
VKTNGGFYLNNKTDFTASFELRAGMERSVVLCCVVLVFYYVVLLWTDQLKVINEMDEKIILSDTLDKAKQSKAFSPCIQCVACIPRMDSNWQ